TSTGSPPAWYADTSAASRWSRHSSRPSAASRSQARLGRPDEDAPALLAADDLVLGGGPHVVQVHGVEGQVAALAGAAEQLGGADPAELGAQLLVERQQVVRDVLGDGGARAAGRARLVVDLPQRGVTALDEPGQLLLRGGPVGAQRRDLRLRLLRTLHDLQHDLLQVGLAALQRLDLRLQVAEVLGGGDLPRVEPLLVALGAVADLLDVLLGLLLLALQVA